MVRFAINRPGQSSPVAMPWGVTACRGVTRVVPNSAGLGYRPTDLEVSPSTGRWESSLPARSDRVCNRGEIR
jgi:hypothetical protein